MNITEYFEIQDYYWCWWLNNSGEGFADRFFNF